MGPFSDLTTFDHLNTRLVRYSDPHCIRFIGMPNSMVVWYSNGKSCDLADYLNTILDHKQAFSVQFPDYHLNTI